jgi:hypothetical protein
VSEIADKCGSLPNCGGSFADRFFNRSGSFSDGSTRI